MKCFNFSVWSLFYVSTDIYIYIFSNFFFFLDGVNDMCSGIFHHINQSSFAASSVIIIILACTERFGQKNLLTNQFMVVLEAVASRNYVFYM